MIFHVSQGVLEKVEIESDDDVQVVLPSGIKEIGPGVFAYSGVRNVVFPESLEKIGRKAFTNTKLQTVKIPDKVMQIDYGAFSYCSNLRSIEIGKGLKDIGCKVFFGCGSLKNVYISEFTEHIDQKAFLGTPETVFYVKNGSYAYNFALKNNFRVQTGSDSDWEDQINKDLLSRYLKRNYISAPVSPDKEYPISLWETLPVHFYCLVEQEAVFHIHSKGLYIPSLLLKHESDESWTDGYVFTENRITAPKDDLVRIKISLRHNPDYINDTTGKKTSQGDEFGR